MSQSQPTRIVVLGGGFAGIYAVRELERLLGRDQQVEITLVNKDNFFVFTPMLHEVAASDLDLTHIVNPIRKFLRHATFFHGDVLEIDLQNKAVVVSHGVETGHSHRLDYDHLVLALGAVTNFFGTPGLAERAFTMKTLGDAIALRNRIIDSLEEGDFECCPDNRRRMLTFVVAGGGFAGVETVPCNRAKPMRHRHSARHRDADARVPRSRPAVTGVVPSAAQSHVSAPPHARGQQQLDTPDAIRIAAA
ncbi:MAG: FAD-dependent oxidoreductase [bacterium]